MGLYSSGVFKDHLNVHEGVKGPLCTVRSHSQNKSYHREGHPSKTAFATCKVAAGGSLAACFGGCWHSPAQLLCRPQLLPTSLQVWDWRGSCSPRSLVHKWCSQH